jgi:hypothetical protein
MLQVYNFIEAFLMWKGGEVAKYGVSYKQKKKHAAWESKMWWWRAKLYFATLFFVTYIRVICKNAGCKTVG